MPPFLEDILDLTDDDDVYFDKGDHCTISTGALDVSTVAESSNNSTGIGDTALNAESAHSLRGTRWSSTPLTDTSTSGTAYTRYKNSNSISACTVTKVYTNERVFFGDHFARQRGYTNANDWVMVNLDDFSVYEKCDGGKQQLVSLHDVSLNLHKKDLRRFYLQGTAINEDGCKCHVKDLAISSLSIGNIGGADINLKPLHSSCTDEIYLDTPTSERHDGYYRLQKPHDNYRLAYEEFLWLANFFKYVIDYLEYKTDMKEDVGLQDFKELFFQRLSNWHHGQTSFREWHQCCAEITDFRRHLTCAPYAAFVQGRADGLRDRSISSHSLWTEIGKPLQPVAYNPLPAEYTLFTTFVADCFLRSFPVWKQITQVCELAPQIREWSKNRRRSLGLGEKPEHCQDQHFELHDNKLYSKASLLLQRAGQALKRQKFTTGVGLVKRAIIARNHKEDCYSRVCKCPLQFAYVLRFSKTSGLHVRWMVLPLKTICSGLRAAENTSDSPYYPIGNELMFAKDDCNCATVHLSDVLASHTITLNEACADTDSELFVHREYSEREKAISVLASWNTLKCPSHVQLTTVSKATNTSEVLKDVRPEQGQVFSIFSGCGLLDAGVEHGSQGLFQPIFAADLNFEAYLSLKANFGHHPHCQLHHEDVNVLLQKLVSGQVEPRDIALFLAGCPCQGFSRASTDKKNLASQKNCSLLAHTLSWVEILSPKMLIIENVPDMDKSNPEARTPSAAGQAVSFLAGLGYQVKLTQMKDSDYGGATIRKRIFIIATVPGIALPVIPSATHGQGQYHLRETCAQSVTRDLEPIKNSTVLNTLHPDHVPAAILKPVEVSIVSKIDKVKFEDGESQCNNLYSAKDKLDKWERKYWNERTQEQQKKSSGTLRRIDPDRPMSTIVKTFCYKNARSDGYIHWADNRILSMEELRRFQGMPDDFVLIGSRIQQLGLLGNSVAWVSSTLLGRALGDAWKASPYAYSDDIAAKMWKSFQQRGQAHDTSSAELEGQDDVHMLDSDTEFEQARERRRIVVKVPPRLTATTPKPRAFNLSQRLISINVPTLSSLNTKLDQALHVSTPTQNFVRDRAIGTREVTLSDNLDAYSDDSLPELKTILTPARSSPETIEVRLSTPIGDSGYSSRSSFDGRARRRRLLDEFDNDRRSTPGTPSKRRRISTATQSTSELSLMASADTVKQVERPQNLRAANDRQTPALNMNPRTAGASRETAIELD